VGYLVRGYGTGEDGREVSAVVFFNMKFDDVLCP